MRSARIHRSTVVIKPWRMGMTAAILAFASVVALSLVSLPGLVSIATGRKIRSRL